MLVQPAEDGVRVGVEAHPRVGHHDARGGVAALHAAAARPARGRRDAQAAASERAQHREAGACVNVQDQSIEGPRRRRRNPSANAAGRRRVVGHAHILTEKSAVLA
jgi:hypothetical protein